jgi:hypothetical protein
MLEEVTSLNCPAERFNEETLIRRIREGERELFANQGHQLFFNHSQAGCNFHRVATSLVGRGRTLLDFAPTAQ